MHRTSRVALDANANERGRNVLVQRLVDLKHWPRPPNKFFGRITFHVLETPDPAELLIEYASANHVDQIVTGARPISLRRRYLGSVSLQVAAEAPCTVTVVRTSPNVAPEDGAETPSRQSGILWC
jgi:eukaryotic-like serine/threonine-protein kinase